MRLSVVNKHGFASLYAVAILQIICVFAILLLSTTRTILVNDKASDQLHHAQLFALYHIKARLVEEVVLPEPKDDVEEGQEEEVINNTFPLEEEMIQYQGLPLHFTYQNEQVLVRIEDFRFLLTIDPQEKCILALVYM